MSKTENIESENIEELTQYSNDSLEQNTTEQQVTVYIHPDQYQSKPNSKDMGQITSTIINHKRTLGVSEFAHEISTLGKTCMLGNLKNVGSVSNPLLERQDLLMLDIDNDQSNKPLFLKEQALSDPFIQNNALFLYETFSSTTEHPKFRIVFMLEQDISSRYAISALYRRLLELYPQADKNIKDCNRRFYGSNTGYTTINEFHNRLDVQTILPDLADFMERDRLSHLKRVNFLKEKEDSAKKEYVSVNTSNISQEPLYELYRKLNVVMYLKNVRRRTTETNKIKKEIQTRLRAKNINTRKTFTDYKDFSDYLVTLDMGKLLDLPTEENFLDIFHSENNPSSRIYKGTNTGKYYYQCHSSSSLIKPITIFQVMEKLAPNRFYYKVLVENLFSELLDVQILNTSKLGRQKLVIDSFINFLESPTLQKNNKYTYSFFKKYSEETIIYLNYLCEQVHKNNEPLNRQILTYKSQETTASDLFKKSHVTGVKISDKKLRFIRNLLMIAGVLDKFLIADIPPYIFDKFTGRDKNYPNVFFVTETHKNTLFTKSEQCFKKLKKRKISASHIKFESISDEFGIDLAIKMFEQTYKNNKSGIETVMSEEYPHLTVGQLNKEKVFTRILLELFEGKDFILESELLLSFEKHYGKSQNWRIHAISTFKHNVYMNYAIEQLRINKILIEKLNLPESYSKKFILIKSDLLEQLQKTN